MTKTFDKYNTTTVKSLEYQVLKDYQNDIDKAKEMVRIMEERYHLMYNEIRTEQPIPNHILRKYEE